MSTDLLAWLHGSFMATKIKGNSKSDKINNRRLKEKKLLHVSFSFSSKPYTQMLNELQHQTRRKKMELRHRVTTLVNGCITVEEARLLVRDGSAGSGNISTGEVVFEMTLATISISL